MDSDSGLNIRMERSVLTVATVTSFLGPFMLSAVNVALPVIQNDLDANAVELSWIATSYLLATAVCLVPIGRIADIHGRRRVFILGLVVFTLSNFFTLFVHSIGLFICLRVLQGMGAAMTVTTGRKNTVRKKTLPGIFRFTRIASQSANAVCTGTTMTTNQTLLKNAFQNVALVKVST